MKLAIVVGHNSEKPGAVRKDTGESEFSFNSRLARRIELIASDSDLKVKTFFRQPGLGYSRELREVYREVDIWGADASVELHFNSVASDKATGTETLTSGTALSMKLAEEVQREMVAALGLRDRGIKTRTSGQRGYKSLVSGRAPAVLIEPFFGSSSKDQKTIDEDSEVTSLAEAVLNGAYAALESFPRSTLKKSRTLAATTNQRRGASAGIITTTSAGLLSVAEAISGSADSALSAAAEAQRWAEYIPVATTVLAVIGVCAFVYMRYYSDKIEEARIDDHERRLR